MDVDHYRRAAWSPRPEADIQRALILHILAYGQPDMIWWHTPNQNPSKTQRIINESLGARAGVGDLCFLRDGKFYSLELKATTGNSRPAQIQWAADVNRCGGFACEAMGLDAALHVLRLWKLLKPKSGTDT